MTVVKFDVAVTAETSDTAKGGGGVKIAVMSVAVPASGDVETASKNVAVTRIQFSVPISLPAGDRQERPAPPAQA
jgi:hypothetical protein